MKMKKILATILSLAMLLSTMCFAVSAEDGNVAKVGDVEYATIEEALSAWTNGTTLTLLDDVTLPDLVKLKSTEHHILDLGTYTLTAASGKHAIEITCEGRSSASYAITINADKDNPGGITANGKACIYYKKSGSTKDRPIIRIYNGVFNGSYSINSISNGNTNCPQVWIYGGTFNGNVNLTKNMLRVWGGTFNGWVNCTGDSSAYREISGGTFKSWQFMTADAPGKFWVGTAASTYNVGLYVDDNGYLVVGGPVITENDGTLGAKITNYTAWSGYLKYSSAAANGLYYTDADMALTEQSKDVVTLFEAASQNVKTTGDFTLDLSDPNASYDGTITLGNGYTFTVNGEGFNGEIVPANGYGLKVEEKEENGVKTITYKQLNDETVTEEVASVTVNGTPYYKNSLEEAYEAAVNGSTITLCADIVYTDVYSSKARMGWNGDYAYSIGMNKDITLDLNGHTITSTGGCTDAPYAVLYTDGQLTITDSSAEQNGAIINNASAYGEGKTTVVVYNTGKLTVEGGTLKNVTPSDNNSPYVIDSITDGGEVALTITDDAMIVSEGFTAVRAMSQGAAGTQTVTIDGGEIHGGVWAALKNGEKDVLNMTISGGEIYPNQSGNSVILSNHVMPDASAGEDNVNISGGTFYGAVGMSQTNVGGLLADGFISGGEFNYNEEPHVSDGYKVIPGPGGIFYVVDEDELVNNIKLSFVKATPADAEGEMIYDINLTADGKTINRLNTVDLTFALTEKSGDMAYEIIESNSEIEINNVNNDANRYEFHYDGKTDVDTDTAATITIGQVKFVGYGVFDFAVATADTNVAYTTTQYDNIVDTFVPGGVLADGTEVGTFDVSDESISDILISTPVRDLTINIDFPNAVENQIVAYQNMKVVVSGDDINDIVIDLGNDATFADIATIDRPEADCTAAFVDGAYVIKITKALTYNDSYDIVVSGAGYRTARYTVRMNDHKTVNFWNNVKDADADVEAGKFQAKKNFLAGDIVKDNNINVYDLSAVVSYFGETGLVGTNNAYAKYDLNRDGFIDSKDVAMVLVSWNN